MADEAKRDDWLDWRGAVEGKEACVEAAANAIRRCRESSREPNDEEWARHICWAMGLDHIWEHVEALRAALAAKEAPNVADALRKEADRLHARADEILGKLEAA